jgi:hypothetical protein
MQDQTKTQSKQSALKSSPAFRGLLFLVLFLALGAAAFASHDSSGLPQPIRSIMETPHYTAAMGPSRGRCGLGRSDLRPGLRRKTAHRVGAETLLGRRHPESARGRIFLEQGEIEAQTLAGCVQARAGRHLVYALFVNDAEEAGDIADVIRVIEDEGEISTII